MTLIWQKEIDNTLFKVHQLISENELFSYLLETNTHTIIIDPVDAEATQEYVERLKLKPEVCLITHYNELIVEELQTLKDRYDIPFFSPTHSKIPNIDNDIEGGDELTTGKFEFTAIHTPGDGLESISYYFPTISLVFTGNILSAFFCPKLKEANEYQYFEALQSLKSLPSKTLVMGGVGNIKEHIQFLKWLSPDDDVEKFSNDTFLSLELEKQYNPFLKAATPQELLDLFGKVDKFLQTY